jgi:imidazolonepropionase-like amidohydrolase
MAHVYTPAAVTACIDAGVRSIEHATLIDRAVCDRMAVEGTYLVPTLVVFEILAEKRTEMGLNDAYLRKLDIVRAGGMNALEMACKAGVRIASGSDLIGPLKYQEYKGRELAIKARVMGAMKAIVSATRTSAECLMIDKELGTLDAGKLADIIMVDGNPLDDLSLFEPRSGKVLLTMIGGAIRWEKGVCVRR